MTQYTQRHSNVPRCRHQHDGRQCQLDHGHHDRYGTPCVYTTISPNINGDTITRFTPHGDAVTVSMPARRNPEDVGPKYPPRKQCAECDNTVERRIHKYCSDDCRRQAKRMQSFRSRQKDNAA